MRCFLAAVMAMGLVSSATARAEGLLYQLPADGSWVRFDMEAKAVGPDGQESVSATGSLTMSSVGRETVGAEPCRWIEISTIAKFKRRGQEGENTENFKLLIPEKNLKKGANPLVVVNRAFRKSSADGVVKELDLQGNDKRMMQSLDEIFHAPLKEITKLDPQVIENKLGKLTCERLNGHETMTDGQNETVVRVQTTLHEKAPFGVVVYELEKERKRDGSSLGKRITSLKLAETGKDAKSAIGDAK